MPGDRLQLRTLEPVPVPPSCRAAKPLEKEAFMRFTVTLEPGEDGMWVCECPAIPGCISQGHSRDEALENIREAIQACLEVRSELGYPLTVETRQIEVPL
jgi:predicted RNase H-like HicB family nuclease